MFLGAVLVARILSKQCQDKGIVLAYLVNYNTNVLATGFRQALMTCLVTYTLEIKS